MNYPRKQTKSLFYRTSITNILIVINAIFFLAVIFPLNSNPAFIEYIALKPLFILQGKYLWTLLISMFIHGSFFHLFANMLSLFFLGNFVEKLIGRKRYIWFYLIAGLSSAFLFIVSSIFFFPKDLEVFAVGASGAIFGIAGLLMILTPNLPVFVMFIPIPIKMKYAVPLLLLGLWLLSISSESIKIGNTAHLGGLIAGLFYGIYLKKRYKKKTQLLQRYFS